jgi:hypothetical protein
MWSAPIGRWRALAFYAGLATEVACWIVLGFLIAGMALMLNFAPVPPRAGAEQIADQSGFGWNQRPSAKSAEPSLVLPLSPR